MSDYKCYDVDWNYDGMNELCLSVCVIYIWWHSMLFNLFQQFMKFLQYYMLYLHL